MSLKGQMTPEIFQIFTWQLVSVHITCRKILKTVRGSYLRVIIKHALFPLRTTSLLVSCSGLWGVCVQTFVKRANFFTTSSWWHDITSSKVSCFSDHFLIFWNQNAMALQFNVHGINLHTSTQIWFFKPLWLAVACRCSSNLNYGH